MLLMVLVSLVDVAGSRLILYAPPYGLLMKCIGESDHVEFYLLPGFYRMDISRRLLCCGLPTKAIRARTFASSFGLNEIVS